MNESNDSSRAISVTAQDLPLCCPQPGAPLWARHPRVYLDVLTTGQVDCPYCGTHFSLLGDKPKGHH